MSNARGTQEWPVHTEENDQGTKSQPDQPDERLRHLRLTHFPQGLPPSQSLKEENADIVNDRKAEKRGKKRLPGWKQLPKFKE
jgi:hypothetical protein